jgi:hypothetical protein
VVFINKKNTFKAFSFVFHVIHESSQLIMSKQFSRYLFLQDNKTTSVEFHHIAFNLFVNRTFLLLLMN